MSILERLKGRAEQAKAEAGVDYRRLVEAIADGEDVKEADAEQILTGAHRTADEAAADVELLRRRRELRAVVDGDAEHGDGRQDVAWLTFSQPPATGSEATGVQIADRRELGRDGHHDRENLQDAERRARVSRCVRRRDRGQDGGNSNVGCS